MTDTSRKIVDDIKDDDPTDELPILPGHLFEGGGSPSLAGGAAAANQSFVNDSLDLELRDANDRISCLSTELRSRTESMLAMQRKLEELQDFAKFLETKVKSGEDVISNVTDELISVRSQQNDVGQQLPTLAAM